MKQAITLIILAAVTGSVSAMSRVNVNHCFKPGVKLVNECLKDARKKTPVEKKVTAKQSLAITKNNVKKGGGAKTSVTSTKDIRCLAYSIFREAGNQKEPDQYAVGQVHMNRLKEGSWGKSMCKVVFAKAQFSWTLEPKMIEWSKRQEEHFIQIAKGLMIDGVYVKRLASSKILHYHATYVNPKWSKQGQLVAVAGDHLFYKNVPF